MNLRLLVFLVTLSLSCPLLAEIEKSLPLLSNVQSHFVIVIGHSKEPFWKTRDCSMEESHEVAIHRCINKYHGTPGKITQTAFSKSKENGASSCVTAIECLL
jgi:hypothetical protein